MSEGREATPDADASASGGRHLLDLVGEVVLATLPALRCIPDGEHRSGCCIYDGAKSRERLRLAVLNLNRYAQETVPRETLNLTNP